MFAKIINNTIEAYPYNPQSEHTLTSFPVGNSYPYFNCYWIYFTEPNNPDLEMYQAVESTPQFNTELNRWEQSWDFVEKPPVTYSPDWDGLYTGLMISQAYQYFVGVGLSNPKISSELGKIIDAIQYGIFRPQSLAALPALQSSLNLFIYVLNTENSPLPAALRTEVESILLANHFTTITLPAQS